ncbi:MAG: hypothetical protein U0838_11120 [Chloroflexota bacterium]
MVRLVKRSLDRYTDRTITTLDRSSRSWRRCAPRLRGGVGQFDAQLNAVAAPVYDARGQVIAAVDVKTRRSASRPGAFPSSRRRSRDGGNRVRPPRGGPS